MSSAWCKGCSAWVCRLSSGPGSSHLEGRVVPMHVWAGQSHGALSSEQSTAVPTQACAPATAAHASGRVGAPSRSVGRDPRSAPQAAELPSGSQERLIKIAAFAVSAYSGTAGRTSKPFNPLLGETFEFVCAEQGFRFISEKVGLSQRAACSHLHGTCRGTCRGRAGLAGGVRRSLRAPAQLAPVLVVCSVQSRASARCPGQGRRCTWWCRLLWAQARAASSGRTACGLVLRRTARGKADCQQARRSLRPPATPGRTGASQLPIPCTAAVSSCALAQASWEALLSMCTAYVTQPA